MGGGVNPARRWFLAYAAALVAASCVHLPALLAAALGIALVAAGRMRWQLLKRSLLALAVFNLSVSLGYTLVALWQQNFVAETLLLLNLRALLMVFLGFWLVSRIDLLALLAGWPTLSLCATLAIGQIRAYQRVLEEFRMAFASRNPQPPRLIDRARHAGAQGGALLDKSLTSAGEVALAMRSRGAFDA